jgi:ubiquinone/menaquinone biosynthesis C-methylase UbiE
MSGLAGYTRLCIIFVGENKHFLLSSYFQCYNGKPVVFCNRSLTSVMGGEGQLNDSEYKSFYDRVGSLIGWDFSKVKSKVEGRAWDFYEEVRTRCKPDDVMLDIGTGGGESVLTLAEYVHLAVGIDYSNGMIEKAIDHLQSSSITNVRFTLMDYEQLQFPEQFFNVVSDRQCGFNSKEVARVLTHDGVFLTQQVSEADKLNLKQAFGRGQMYGTDNGTLLKQYLRDLAEAGFTDIQTFTYDADAYYETSEDLIFLLKHTPIIPNFGQKESDFAVLSEFIEANESDQGIRTNEERFMIIARK